MSKPYKAIELFFQEGTSDKLYVARIVDVGSARFDVEVEWGRRGAKLNQGKKAVGVALAEAEKTYARLVREKTSKGYQAIAGDVKPAAVAPPEGEGSGSKVQGKRPKVGRVAQLLTPVEADALEKLLADDSLVAQQKLDGVRVLVHVGDPMLATNRAGQATDIAADILAGLGELPHGTVVDGEVLGGKYWLFDVLAIGKEEVSKLGYVERWERLDGEVEPGLSGPVSVLAMSVGKDKKKLLESLRAQKAEGIVFKRRDAPYTAGRHSTQLKHKFVKSADVAIIANAGNAYRMVVQDEKKQFDVGKVFAGTTNASRKDLDARLARGETPVAEVQYLYATADDQLYQPVFVRTRDDKEPDECLRSQLVHTDRTVIPS